MELFCQWGKGSQTLFEIGWDLKADEQKGILDLFVNRMTMYLIIENRSLLRTKGMLLCQDCSH